MEQGLTGGAPYKGKLQVEAYEAGVAAHADGVSREGSPNYQRRSFNECWERGWDEAARAAGLAAAAERARAELARREEEPVPKENPRALWPKDKPLPTVYQRPPVPCPCCRRLLDKNGGRAAVLRYISGGKARFRCRATKGCPEFTLPVQR